MTAKRTTDPTKAYGGVRRRADTKISTTWDHAKARKLLETLSDEQLSNRVDAAQTRRAINCLHEQGVGYRELAKSVSVSRSTLKLIADGRRDTVSMRTALEVLATDRRVLGALATIDSAEFRKIIDGYVQRDIPITVIHSLTGISKPVLYERHSKKYKRISVRTMKRLLDAKRELDELAMSSSPREKRAAGRSLRTIRCVQCGKPFSTMSKQRMLCSHKCRAERQKELRRQRTGFYDRHERAPVD